jgi:hypothetical protein
MPYKYEAKKGGDGERAKDRITLQDGDVVQVVILPPSAFDGQEDWAGTRERVSKSGNDMMQIHCEVCVNGKRGGEWIFDYIVYGNDVSDRRFFNMLAGIGLDPTVPRSITPELLFTKSGYVEIEMEEWRGKPRPRIAFWINPKNYEERGIDPHEVNTEQDYDEEPPKGVPDDLPF